MGPLEALLVEEKLALASPPQEPFLACYATEPNSRIFELLPYLKHQPYITLITDLGVSLRIQADLTRLGISQAEHIATSTTKNAIDKAEERVLEAVKKVENKYGLSITKHDVEAYLAEFAGRILTYAKHSIPGLLVEIPEPAKLINEGLASLLFTPDVTVVEAVRSVQVFYENATSNKH